MPENQPPPPDWVNDVPARYGPDWPEERRCRYVFEAGGMYLSRLVCDRPCGYPTEDGHERCLFHRDGEKDTGRLRAEMESAVAEHVHLDEAQLRGSKLWFADLPGARLDGANLSGAQLDGINLHGAQLWSANLADTELREANLSRAELGMANLARAQMRGAELSGARLQGAGLAGASLWQARLSGAQLFGAHLSDANLWQASLSGAILAKADLSGAVLSDADLSGADLSDADLTEAWLRNAKITPDTDLDGVTWGPEDERFLLWKWLHVRNPVLCDEREAKDKDFLSECERLYRQIKRCYQEAGQYDMAGTFFVREMECKRKQLPRWSLLRPVYHVLHFLCDYFENPWRVVVIGAIVILLGAFLQGAAGVHLPANSVTGAEGPAVAGPGLTWLPSLASLEAFRHALYFSIVTFTATGYGDYVPNAGWGQTIAAAETLTGVFLMATFLVCLARKFGRA